MVVFDASTLILLAKCDLLPLLAQKTPLAVTPEVQAEVMAKPEAYDAKVAGELLREGKIEVFKPGDARFMESLGRDFNLGAGEISALALAREKGVPIATDDGPAIKAAKILGIPFLTAIHVLLELRSRDRLGREAAEVKLDLLARLGRYNSRILEDARVRLREGR